MTAWYEYPRIDNFGSIDPQGAYWKPDTNVLTPPGLAVTAILSGRITSVQRTGWGQTVVTQRLDQALNNLATHMFFEHMHDAAVSVGQRIAPGDTLGHANLAGEGANLGVGLYPGDVYGSGSAWQTLQDDLRPGGRGLLNPVPLIEAAKAGRLGNLSNLSSYGSPVASDGGGNGGVEHIKKVVHALKPDASVTDTLGILDLWMELVSPFDVSGVQQDTIAGVTFTDPMAWIQQVGQNIIDDASAFVARSILILLGFFILYKIVSAFIDFGAIGDSIQQSAKLAAQAAVFV